MRIRTLVYYITTGFVVGIIVLIMVQYITRNNVKELISGNEKLLNEYKVNNELFRLQKDLLLLDNKVKAAEISGDSDKIRELELGISRIKEDAWNLQSIDHNGNSSKYILELDKLIDQKIVTTREIVDHMHKADLADSTNITIKKTLTLSENITTLAHKIDTSGRVALAQKIKSVDRSGRVVQNWNLYIIVFVLFLFTAFFLIIINRMKKQAELIRQLNTSEKKLKEAALIKENFLANMSHEIRTPLNAILGYSNLLQKKNFDDDSRLHLETVQQSGETLLSIVNDILDLSKIESGMMRIEEAPFSINDVIHALAAMFHHKAEEKGLKLTTHLSSEVPDMLIGDATRLTQILVNLVGNALKFTEIGEIKLEVQGTKNDPENILLNFSVTDTGIGIEENKLETIFERFRQAEDHTTRKYGGTGLGLSIVRDLVYLQNGSVQVKSIPGKGTTIIFSIPYKIPANNRVTADISNDSIADTFDNKITILVVEDNVINQGLIKHLLTEWGIKHTMASNGKEAVDILIKEAFDLILMDIQMPDMDGYAATQEIRQRLKLKTPIIAMTANAMPGEREKSLGFGMNEHIAKPIRAHDLFSIIARFTQTISLVVEENLQLTSPYKIIDLRYMKEISQGDREYEKIVTEQFLKLIPEETADLLEALKNKNLIGLKQTAHYMKSSISVMGLETLLEESLEMIENECADLNKLSGAVDRIAAICRESLVEARHFHESLHH